MSLPRPEAPSGFVHTPNLRLLLEGEMEMVSNLWTLQKGRQTRFSWFISATLACIWQHEVAQAFAGGAIDYFKKFPGFYLPALNQTNWYANRSIPNPGQKEGSSRGSPKPCNFQANTTLCTLLVCALLSVGMGSVKGGHKKNAQNLGGKAALKVL